MKILLALSMVCGAWASSFAHAASPRGISLAEEHREALDPGFTEVLSVTRLRQPLDETPGAVTIIDARTLRRIGARSIFDALRLVPGIVVENVIGSRSFAAYHTITDPFGARMQVFVDGHSLYTALTSNQSMVGLRDLAVEDVERIEVLRGSNSAAYGANAYLGVINIVTRHSSDTQGTQLSARLGSDNIQDLFVQRGWGDMGASHRVSFLQNADSGFMDVPDAHRLQRVRWRSDVKLEEGRELTFTANAGRETYDLGNKFEFWYPPHPVVLQSINTGLHWHKVISADESLQLRTSWSAEDYRDNITTPVSFLGMQFPLNVDLDLKSQLLQIEAQHSLRVNDQLRWVWGGAWQHQSGRSIGTFNTPNALGASSARLFGNAEWKPDPRWIVNLGATHESYSGVGEWTLPRLMLNHHLTAGHTLRMGANRSNRAPSVVERRGDHRFVGNGVSVQQYSAQGANLQPEYIDVRELGYLGYFPQANSNIDVRVFEERMTGLLTLSYRTDGLNVVGLPVMQTSPSKGATNRGIEVQWQWRPTLGVQVMWSGVRTQSVNADAAERVDWAARTPKHINTLALLMDMPANYEVGLVYSATSAYAMPAPVVGLPSYNTPAVQRLDARVARKFRLNDLRGEVDLKLESLTGPVPVLTHEKQMTWSQYPRRVYLSLSLHY